MEKFRVENLGIEEFENWILAVRGKQITLGSCVILLKRAAVSLGDLTAQEASELPIIAAFWEERVSGAFQPDRFNYVAAMMKDPFVHFHAIPRYSGPRAFQGQEFHDPSWPGLIEFRDLVTPEDILGAVRDALRR